MLESVQVGRRSPARKIRHVTATLRSTRPPQVAYESARYWYVLLVSAHGRERLMKKLTTSIVLALAGLFAASAVLAAKAKDAPRRSPSRPARPRSRWSPSTTRSTSREQDRVRHLPPRAERPEGRRRRRGPEVLGVPPEPQGSEGSELPGDEPDQESLPREVHHLSQREEEPKAPTKCDDCHKKS